MTGPAVPMTTYTTGDGYKHLGYIPTATFNWTGGTNAWVFQYPVCTAPVSFTYLAVNGNLPNGGLNGGGGGGSINFAGGNSSNITLEYNWFYGNQADQQNDCCASVLIYVSGSGTAQGYSVMSNLTIAWNQFGSSGGCSNVMSTFFYPSSETGNNNYNYNNTGGYCAAVAIGTSTTNLVEENNVVYHTEQGFKFFEPGPNGGQVGCSNPSANQYCHANANILYNDFWIHRIAIEAQDTPNPTMNFLYNSWHDPTNPGYGSWGLFAASVRRLGGVLLNINTNVDYNVEISNVTPPTLTGRPGGMFRALSSGGRARLITTLVKETRSVRRCFRLWRYAWTIAHIYQGPNSAVCNEEHQTTNPNPAQTNNSASTTIAALTSATPTISPGSGTFTTSQNVTFTNTGTNRDANTGIWYTTDGSTPTPGSGTAQYLASGGSIAVSTTTTVKAVGMWGAANQPASYALGYGYVPSAVVSATYTSGTPPTLNSVSLTATGSGDLNCSGRQRADKRCLPLQQWHDNWLQYDRRLRAFGFQLEHEQCVDRDDQWHRCGDWGCGGFSEFNGGGGRGNLESVCALGDAAGGDPDFGDADQHGWGELDCGGCDESADCELSLFGWFDDHMHDDGFRMATRPQAGRARRRRSPR